MGFIISSDILDLGSISARTENASYPAGNVSNLWHLKRRFRAQDATAGDWLLKFDLGSTTTVASIFLNDVNFDKVQIQANDSDSWDSPAYDSGEVTISQNSYTGRYQVYIPASFTRQWVRVYIPSTASAVGYYTDAWEVGTVVLLGSVTEIAKGAREIRRGAEDQIETVNLPSGAQEVVQVGDVFRWQGELSWIPRRAGDESELLTIHRTQRGNPIIFYRNSGDSWDAYLCRRDTSYSATEYSVRLEAEETRLVEII